MPSEMRAYGGDGDLAEASRSVGDHLGGSQPAEAHGSEMCGESSWGVMVFVPWHGCLVSTQHY